MTAASDNAPQPENQHSGRMSDSRRNLLVMILSLAFPVFVCVFQQWQLRNLYPETPAEGLLLDRMEVEYAVLLMQAAEFEFSATEVIEPDAGTTLLLPWGALLPYSLFVSAFGLNYGFPMAEICITIAMFLVWRFLFFQTTEDSIVSSVMASAVTAGGLDWFLTIVQTHLWAGNGGYHKYVLLISIGLLAGAYLFRKRISSVATATGTFVGCLGLLFLIVYFQYSPGELYNDRFPRPSITLIPNLLSVGLLAAFVRDRDRMSLANGVALGGLMGWLINADVFAFVANSLLSVGLWLLLAGIDRKLFIRWILGGLIGFGVCSAPIWYLRAVVAEDYLTRVGGSPTAKGYFPYLTTGWILGYFCLGIITVFLLHKKFFLSEKSLVILGVPLSYIVGPAFFKITGQSLQIWHYYVLTPAAIGFALASLIASLIAQLKQSAKSPRVSTLLLAVMLISSVVPISQWFLSDSPSVYFACFQRPKDSIGGRTKTFEAIDWIEQQHWPENTVLGSTSSSMIAYWQACRRPVLNPLSSTTGLNTKHLEARVACLKRALGMSDLQFRELLESGFGYSFVWHYLQKQAIEEGAMNRMVMLADQQHHFQVDLLVTSSNDGIESPPNAKLLFENTDYQVWKTQR